MQAHVKIDARRYLHDLIKCLSYRHIWWIWRESDLYNSLQIKSVITVSATHQINIKEIVKGHYLIMIYTCLNSYNNTGKNTTITFIYPVRSYMHAIL